ncbi:succinylglutamate desuccinylase/aspartoacylase family protein [Desulforhopalus sp. IMCC35007]|uniref:succinylglutamate desuccinylase/aspartoacylase family protein n=1 Tax=Desulforhopalus sp. IMCC35007 TaxID=2569543 RepID=UPI0010AE8FD7|nr:succinylglutamate desuccinylase/aspartoacylase family protein [Desulforhopalus sp. IMCC35007]TKB06889.1 succinylglutamate desuccinylase/aspartoacylase family protein [Desulforhopalus sp. IMCC35007]
MNKPRMKKSIADWFGEHIEPGESRDVSLAVGESYSGMTVQIQLHIKRAIEDGPVVFVTAALHGDEINGCGAVRQIILDNDLQLLRGALILVPVLNLPAFDRHSRYLPDRRDLNRSFPGTADGSLASRMAYTIFNEIVMRCDYGIDLHTASVRRTNYPTIRGDLKNQEVRSIAEVFGTELIMNGEGPKGSLRREATKAGCPTIIMEGGEIWKVEPGIVETTVRGIKNILCKLKMLDTVSEAPPYQIIIEKSKWIRAEHGGFLHFHIQPGDLVEKGQTLTTNTTLLGAEQGRLYAPFNGVVMGMTSLPSISPGEPICHLGELPQRYCPATLTKLREKKQGLEQQVLEELGSSLLVVEPSEVAGKQ